MAAWKQTCHLTGWARLAVGVVAGVVAVTVVGAYCFAASLGSRETGLAPGSSVAASCGSGMTLAYTTAYYPAESGYAVSGIELSNIPVDCQDESLSATFSDDRGSAVGSPVTTTLTRSGTTQYIPVAPDSTAIDASAVSGVSVVVS